MSPASDRPALGESLRLVGWVLVVAAFGSLAAIFWELREGIEQCNALTMVLLLHGAQLAAAFAHGLSWRATRTALHGAAAWSCYVTTLVWLYTWFEPAQDWVAAARRVGRLLFEVGVGW